MDPIARVKHLMRQTYKCPLLNEQLCEQVGTSYDTFRKQFRRVEGMTLSEYYQKLRFEEAERLLLDSDKLVFQIAHELGFRYETNFSNWFYRRTGMWPTEYREKLVRGGGSLGMVNLNIQIAYPKFIWFFSWILSGIC